MPKPTLIEELTEHFHQAHTNSDLGRVLLHAEKSEMSQVGICVNWKDQKSIDAFADSVLRELDAIRQAIFIIAVRVEPPDY
jgi:hypothetical protein